MSSADKQQAPVHRRTGSRRTTSDGQTKREPAAKIETFELSQKEHPYIPVSTTKILGKFTRDPPPDLHDVALQERRAVLQKHAETVEELRKWAKNRESSTAVKILLRTIFWKDVKVRMPSEQKLYHSINHFFPPRSEMKVIVCDFGEGRAERNEVRLGDIERGKRRAVAVFCRQYGNTLQNFSKSLLGPPSDGCKQQRNCSLS
jgi:hypothetical protein